MKLKSFVFFVLVFGKVLGQEEHNQILKFNFSSLPFNAYSAQYEKVIGKRLSLNLGLGYRPKKIIPFASQFEKVVDFADSRIDYVSFDNIKKRESEAGLMSITPELRFYLSKKQAPYGTYLGLFGRYNYYPSKAVAEMDVYYGGLNFVLTLPIDTRVYTKTAGLVLGHQFKLGNRFTFDWSIIGGHYGRITPHGDSNQDLSAFDAEFRDRLRNKIIETFKIDTNYLSVDVNPLGVKIENIQKLPFINLRGFGFSLGYKF